MNEVSSAEWRVRCDLAACFRLVALNGEDDLNANHITVTVPGEPGAFLINPPDLLFDEITASSLIKVDSAGHILSPTPYEASPTGFIIHGAIHDARPDAACVLHLHSDAGVALSCLDEVIRPLHQIAMLINEDVAFHEYEGFALDDRERESLQRDLGQKNLMMLRNHGTLTVGRSVAEAYLRHYLLEKSARIQLLAMAALSSSVSYYEAKPDVAHGIAEAFRKNSDESAERLLWPALLRRLDRICPDYKT
jgi:ribulose-5-phosphate 4-epimerase/fuculose-1-phosphate aldolase